MNAARDRIGLRPYRPEDLDRVLRFVGECCVLSDFCGCLHPGDVAHVMSNSLRGRDLAQHIHLYETPDGQIGALVLLYPVRFAGYDLLIHPAQRTPDLETRLAAWSERALWALMQAAGSAATDVGSDVMDCDAARRDALLSLGYDAAAAPYLMFTTRTLHTPIPESVLPEGYTLRSVAGEHEAALVSEAHSGAFGSNWQPDDYLRVMRTPGFEVDRELVVVAPDGRIAAFLVYWIDPVSRSGLFEPVGCHPDFQRRGLTQALMYEGMRRMVARGMTTAIVKHKTDNAASTALYRSAGFTPRYAMYDFRKAMHEMIEKKEVTDGNTPNSN